MTDDELRSRFFPAIQSFDSFDDLSGVWVHRKTGGRYKIVTFCLIEADLTLSVVYRNLANNLTWCRPISEFTDGRFVREEGV